jgi:predicted ATPase/HPt (histidine-containing phosphotransfer) domain-containing protein/PAS domain-containing protein
MNGNEQEPVGEDAYQTSETVAILQRCIWRRARDVSAGSTVLLHSLRNDVAEPRRVLELELQTWRRLGTLAIGDHPREIQGVLSLIVEDFQGLPLAIPANGLELGLCLEVALGMARLLERLHQQGLLHEDVNPNGFLVNPTTLRVEFSDLLAVSEESSSGARSDFGPSLAHVAPERMGRLNRRVDKRADYYSLGITLFQMLTGQLPFTATDAIGWAHAHVSKRPPLVTDVGRGIPPVLARLVSKLLEKDPDDRYQSGHGLLSDLSVLCDSHRRTGALPALALGSRDVSSHFVVNREVAGREVELSALKGVLEELRDGKRRLVLMAGPAGAGKSAVIAELLRRHTGGAARLLSTALEEQSRAIPLSGLAQALRGLAADLLALSETDLEELRRRVSEALGHSASVMSDLVPALACVTGPSASIVPLNPLEAQRRLQHVFVSFVRVFATSERPLVFVLDDAQWLDAASAEVLAAILSNPDSNYVMVLATFRGIAASDVPALLKMQQSLQQANEPVVTLPLAPLSSGVVNTIVARSLRTSVADAQQLAAIVTRKTDGNPFFIGQLLVSLQRQGALQLDVERGCWSADLQRAESHPPCDNVGVFMAGRLEQLGPDTVRLLSAAACFGMRFDLATLSETLDQPVQSCFELVREAVAQRLLTEAPAEAGAAVPSASPPSSESDAYVFEHSRVQQAALSRSSDAERVRFHARIGRILRGRLRRDDPPSRIFELLTHLSAARSVIVDAAERRDLLELELAASRQALRSGAWGVAAEHASIAVELLGHAELASSPDLAFGALFARAEAAFLLADARAEAFCQDALEVAPDRVARGRIHVLKTRILEHAGRMREAVAQVRGALAELGVCLPEAPDEINQGIGEGIGKLKAHLDRVTIEGLPSLPMAVDVEARLVLELLAQVIPPAFQTYPPLFLLAELTMFDLALSRGVDAVSCKNFADCGILLIALLGDYDAAYRLGLAAFELLKRFSPTPVEAGVCFVFAGFLSHWKEAHREVFPIFDRAEKSGLELGDLQHVAYAKNERAQRSFSIGERLPACREQVAQMRRYLTHISATGQLVNALVVERAAARLMTTGAEQEAVALADREAFAVISAEKSAQYSYAYGHAQMMTSFILGDFASARRWLEFTRDFLLIAAGQFSLPDFRLFEGLLAARADAQEPPEVREVSLKLIVDNLRQLEAWSGLCPSNFSHKYHLLAAEHARLTDEPLHVILAHYRDSVRTAGDGFIHLRALVHEHEAELWLSKDDPLHAKTCLQAAYRLYGNWGARAKLELLAHRYPALLADSIGGESTMRPAGLAPGYGFDGVSLLKATQSIFAEVESARLFAALMATLIENAGAEHGCLVLRDDTDQKYYVEARAHVQQPPMSHVPREAYAEAEALCPNVVSYVLHTGEAVTLDDAATSGPFRTDPRVRKHRVRSVLCAPIMRQGEILGALYVENNLSSHAFTRERLAALQVIASQAAISIYNAQLYDNLERRVAQRTEELALKNHQIASMLDNLDQGIFTIDRTLRVQPGHSRRLAEILGTTDLVGRDCLTLLTSNAAVPADKQSAADAALCFSFDQDPSLAALNAGHLIHEVERTGPGGEAQFLEISWSFIASDAGLVERILVTIRDVTLLRRLKQAAHDKEREIEIIVQVLDGGVEAMHGFCASCHELLAQNRAALAPEIEPSAELLAAGFRNLHTLKGNARLLGLSHLVESLHLAEDAYDALRRRPLQTHDTQELRRHLDLVENTLGEYETVSQRRLFSLMNKSDERNERALHEIRTLVASAGSEQAPRDLHPLLRGILARLDATSLERLVDDTRAMLPSLAAELGKPPPTVLTQQAEARLASDWAGPVKDILVQCFRNALYHGLEPADARALAGKPAAGTIRVSVRTRPSGCEIEISDDGRGLAIDKLRERAERRELSDEAVADQIFLSGVSTAETVGRVAGRGVGLDIVRANLRARGGDAMVRFAGEERNGRRPFVLVVILPKSAMAPGSVELPEPSPAGVRVPVEA